MEKNHLTNRFSWASFSHQACNKSEDQKDNRNYSSYGVKRFNVFNLGIKVISALLLLLLTSLFIPVLKAQNGVLAGENIVEPEDGEVIFDGDSAHTLLDVNATDRKDLNSKTVLPQTGPSIRELAGKAGILIGVRAFLRNDAQKALVEKEFNTSTRTCYPNSINKSQGQHDFESFNEGVNWFYERGMKPMHHMLCGPTQYEPAWIKTITSTTVLDSLLEERIRSIMLSNDNGLKVNVWNVVNEAFNWNAANEGEYFKEDMCLWVRLGYEDDKSGLSGDDRINNKHPVFIRKAFEIAAKYAKGKLELRDNGCEKPSRKARAFYQLVRHLQQSGVRIDGVGLQCHFPIEGKGALNPQGLAYEISKYRKIGVEVYLTEVDFGRKKIPWTPEIAEKQKQEYKKLITVALNEGVSQVHFWGLRDADEGWLKDENPLLFDEDLKPKPAYFGIKEALKEFLDQQSVSK